MATFLGIGEIPTPWHGCNPHQHEVWEFVYYLEGTGAITVGETPVPFRPGTVVCLPPRIPHWESSERGYRNYHLLFSDFVPPVRGIPTCVDDANRSFLQVASLLHRESRLAQPRSRLICQELAQVLIEYIERWTAGDSSAPLVGQLKDLLYRRYREPGFGVAEALRELRCAPDHARRVFRTATGQSPLGYLTGLRIQEAKHLLASGAPVKEVAARVGLADPYYFSRVFTRKVGRSPQAWTRAVAQGKARP
jgi:AraC family transcriptional activator of pobA